ncbi:MAG: DUF116 domain-containing protein [Archaeoglobus sp.]|nr:DUF116 domain-containing protein [Archaeoglobus sp.]
MLELIARLMALGADLSSKTAIKKALAFIGEDADELVDQIYVSIKNNALKSDFARTPVAERALFLPQCLRDPENCKAKLTEIGYICERCGSCSISEIIEDAERLGYKHIYIVPGGSMVIKILKNNSGIKAALGVACYPELSEAIERLSTVGFHTLAVPLLKTGCVNTEVDVWKVKQLLRLGLGNEG